MEHRERAEEHLWKGKKIRCMSNTSSTVQLPQIANILLVDGLVHGGLGSTNIGVVVVMGQTAVAPCGNLMQPPVIVCLLRASTVP